MDRENVIRMAREAGWMHEHDSETGFVAEAAIKFATLVAAAEREACAKACESYTDNDGGTFIDHEGHGYECAASIRARGQA